MTLNDFSRTTRRLVWLVLACGAPIVAYQNCGVSFKAASNRETSASIGAPPPEATNSAPPEKPPVPSIKIVTHDYQANTASIFDVVVFDPLFYADSNPDLGKAGLISLDQLKAHWQNYGRRECRRGSAAFSVQDYLTLNPDIAKSVAGNCEAGIDNYLQHGRLEGRAISQHYLYGWNFGSGQTTFGNEKLTIRTASRYAGAVEQVWFRGRQIVNNHDSGRLFQTAWSYDDQGECYNPTEGGSAVDGAGPSTSRNLESFAAPGIYRGTTQPALWNIPGIKIYCGKASGTTLLTDDRLTKTVSVDGEGDSQTIAWTVKSTIATQHSSMLSEILTGYENEDFKNYFVFNPSLGKLVKFSATSIENPDSKNLNSPYPIVLASTDLKIGVGVILIDQIPSESADGRNHVGFYQGSTYTDSLDESARTTKWAANVNYTKVKQGDYTARLLLIFGELEEIESRIQSFYQKHPGELINLLNNPKGIQVFDPLYYAVRNPDVVALLGSDKRNLLGHFLTYGIFEGRKGSETFDVKAYLSQLPPNSKLASDDFIGGIKLFLSQ